MRYAGFIEVKKDRNIDAVIAKGKEYIAADGGYISDYPERICFNFKTPKYLYWMHGFCDISNVSFKMPCHC